MKALLEQIVKLPSGKDVPDEVSLALMQAARRELHAGLALQGMLAGRKYVLESHDDISHFAGTAVKAADALIAELDKQ